MGDRMRRWIAVLVGLAWVAAAAPAVAQERVALVIGNGAYRNATPLPNPPNDAADLARALRRIGFVVIEGRDLDKPAMEERIRTFGRALDRASTALFFYAGHGLQVAGRNYLVPVDARLERPGDLSFETVEVGQVLGQMESGPRVNLVFLDACRDNPLARTLARSLGTRSGSVGTGLASIQSAVGTMIAYATQPDNVAYDGDGRNSPFTAALLKHLPTPGLDIAVTMRRIRSDVVAATQSRQVPWDHSSLIGDVVLVPAAAATSGPGQAPPVSAPAAATPGAADAERAWAVTKDTTSVAVLEDFVRQFGGTPYGSMARARLDELRRERSPVVPEPPRQPPAPAPIEARLPPSFDCAAHHGADERAICRSDRLSRLDRTLDTLYATVRDRLPTGRRTALRDEQRAWLRQRTACGDSETCLTGLYESRITQLQAWR